MRNIKTMKGKIGQYEKDKIRFEDLFESFEGWRAYAKWGDNYNLVEKLKLRIVESLWNKL